ncbi:MAG: alginate export family protein [Candidatus Omnitrophota bacterium]
MGKRLILVLALALVVGLTFGSAYAEVQNVKVSGDIIASGVARSHFNLNNNVAGDESVLKQNFLMSQIRLRVDADLTDNVSATVRLINERIWNGQGLTDSGSFTSASSNTSIDVDLAYVTLKEFLYSPLTLTVGRQEIEFGNKLIIGNAGAINTNIPTDLSERRAFDAVRATLNYDPLIVDLVYAQVKQENSVDRNTVSLAGINAKYALTKNTDLSAYYWLKRNNLETNPADRTDSLNTIGALISSTPIENLTASLEAAYQFGKNTETANQGRHDAWALQAMADYTLAKVKMTPKLGASWTYLSGDKGATRNEGWDSMFYDQKLNNIVYAVLPFSNMNAFNLKASCKPVEDVTISAVYGYYDVAHDYAGTYTIPNTYDGGRTYNNNGTTTTGNYTGKSHLGDAIDATIVYDYTEDVQFGLTGGWFRPGNALESNGANATQIIGSMKVSF